MLLFQPRCCCHAADATATMLIVTLDAKDFDGDAAAMFIRHYASCYLRYAIFASATMLAADGQPAMLPLMPLRCLIQPRCLP